MDVRNCKKCGKLFNYVSGPMICPLCKEELEEKLEISFEDEPFDTVNGFVISRLEHIPEEGEDFEFTYKGYTFRILEVKEHMIQSVLARKEVEEPLLKGQTEVEQKKKK